MENKTKKYREQDTHSVIWSCLVVFFYCVPLRVVLVTFGPLGLLSFFPRWSDICYSYYTAFIYLVHNDTYTLTEQFKHTLSTIDVESIQFDGDFKNTWLHWTWTELEMN